MLAVARHRVDPNLCTPGRPLGEGQAHQHRHVRGVRMNKINPLLRRPAKSGTSATGIASQASPFKDGHLNPGDVMVQPACVAGYTA
jgi:hypothetical protein